MLRSNGDWKCLTCLDYAWCQDVRLSETCYTPETPDHNKRDGKILDNFIDFSYDVNDFLCSIEFPLFISFILSPNTSRQELKSICDVVL